MRHLLFIFLSCILFVLQITPAFATDLPRLLILGNDHSRDTIRHDSRPFNQVLDSISNALLDEGFDVKDESALSQSSTQVKSRRSQSQLLQVARNLGIDIAVIFSVYPNMKKTESSMRIHPRVSGRLISVFDGSRLGNFDIKSQLSVPVEKPYSRNDQQEAMTEIAGRLGREVGKVLTDRIAQYVDAEGGMIREWELNIEGFNNYEIMDMEDMFQTFDGYDSHRIKPNAYNKNGHSTFLYRSSADSAKLKSNIVNMLAQMNVKGDIKIHELTITVSKGRGIKTIIDHVDSW
ncbi:hypothetical protein [Maridesulfovibrio sp.]|uniref:hypothetical protein n=1 Tax=Maridesulfovibrio sp. TaxID=2795000 RepID=UPI0029CA2E46|nr:hypothetical protein [Maridesulfovibrio sp.]